MEKCTVKNFSVYKAINAVQLELLNGGGVGKNSRNNYQGYSYRGIDDLQNALAPAMVKHGLVILPEVLEKEVKTYPGVNNKGKPANTTHVFLKVKYQMICMEDGSSHDVVVYGEANDTTDKATNKAMSAAFKYMCLQAFCIPTESEAQNEADRFHHEIPPQENYPQNRNSSQGQNQPENRPNQNRQNTGHHNTATRNNQNHQQHTNNHYQEQTQPVQNQWHEQNPQRENQQAAQYMATDKAQMLIQEFRAAGIHQGQFKQAWGVDRLGMLMDNQFDDVMNWIYGIQNHMNQQVA